MWRIAGIVTPGSAEALLPVAIRHREPDNQGAGSLGRCPLATTRLAIMDLSERGRMAKSGSGGSLLITNNGEGYDTTELRKGFERLGHQFNFFATTEVGLPLYRKDEEYARQRFNRIEASVAWRRIGRLLVLARWCEIMQISA